MGANKLILLNILLMLYSSGASNLARAQNICIAALRSDVLVSAVEQRVKLNELINLSQDTYDLLKKSGKSSANFSLDVIIPAIGALGAAFDSSNSYSDYLEKKVKIQNTYNFSSDTYFATFNSRTVTSDASFTAFNECMKNYLVDSKGIGISVQHETKSDVQITIENHGPVGASLKSALSNGMVPGQGPAKLFGDGKKIAPGGTIPLTIRRGANGVVEFSIEANPQLPIQPFYSRWEEPPPELFWGDVDIQMPTETSLGRHDEGFIYTTNYNGKTSGGDARLTFEVTNPNYYIKSVDVGCTELAHSGACQYYWSKDCRVSSEAKAKSGICTWWTNSWPTNWTIGAEQFTTIPGPSITYQHVIIFPGQEFTFAVPTDAAAAVFHYHFKGGDVTLSPSDSDNNMVLVNHFTRGNFNIYNYNMTKVK